MDHTNKYIFKYFKRFLRPYRQEFIFGSVLRIIGATVWLYNAYALALVVDYATDYTPGSSLIPLYWILGIWVVVVLIRNVAVFGAKYFVLTVGEKAATDAEIESLRHLSRLDASWHEKENTGNKLKRVQRGARGIFELFRVWIVNVIEIVVRFIGALLIIATFDFILAILIVVYQFIYYAISTAFRFKLISSLDAVNVKEEESTGLLFEIASNIRTVKILGMADALINKMRIISNEYIERIKKRLFWDHGGILSRGVWQGLVHIGLIIFIIWGITEGRYDVAFLVLFSGYFFSLTDAVNEFSSATQTVAVARTNINRLAELLEEPISIEDEQGKLNFPSDWKAIHIKDLSFSYGNNEVLSEVDLTIKKGERVGIVGLSGAGKSTLFRILLKEYEDYEGDVLIDNLPLREIKKSSYVKHIATVLQETEVFNLSLKENILLANASEWDNTDLFNRAIEIAHVKDFLPKLPQGVDTLVGEKGVKLSGGERQRLGIARAIFKKPGILFFDEATSHLDVESEQKIKESLREFLKGITAVVIAHRLSTIKEMDRIIVIEAGRIVEEGSFEELHSKEGRFRELWDKQRAGLN